MFALISTHEAERLSINLKNTPDENILMRQIYEEVIPGYHMNNIMFILQKKTIDKSTVCFVYNLKV